MLPSLNTELDSIRSAVQADLAVILDHNLNTAEAHAAFAIPDNRLNPEIAWPITADILADPMVHTDPRQIAFLVPTEVRIQFHNEVKAAIGIELTPTLVLILIWSLHIPPAGAALQIEKYLQGDLRILAQDWAQRQRNQLTIEQLTSTLQVLNDALIRIDDQYGMAHLNPAAATLLGLPNQQSIDNRQIAKAMQQLQRRMLNPENAMMISKVLHANPSASLQNVLWAFPESPRFLSISTMPLPQGRLWVLSDVSERETALRAEARTNQRFRFLAENVKDMILRLSPDGQRTYVSPAAHELTGFTPEELMEEPHRIITHPDEYQVAAEAFRKALISGAKYFQIEQRILRKDGQYIWTEVSNTMIRDPQTGNLIEAIAIVHDISERKQAEEAIQAALQKERELGELKSSFLSMATHEFRTPLTVILMMADMLLRYRDRYTIDQQQARLSKIRDQVKYMQVIMEDVLQQTKLDSGKVHLNPTNTNLNLLLMSVIEEFDLMPENQGRLVYERISPDVFADLDEHLSRQVCINLISNALKYSPDKQPVRIKLFNENAFAVLEIADSGIGIPAADIPHLFEPFHRATNVGNISGTGLGLSVCLRAMQLQGGTIAVESEVQQGTTFRVYWPRGSTA